MTGQTTPEERFDGPVSYLDLWSDEVLENPYPSCKILRDMGPAVWLGRHQVWAITRHKNVREGLLAADAFSSASGVSMNAQTNADDEGVMVCTDDPEHRKLRSVFMRPLTPAAVAALNERFIALAQERIESLLVKDEFDGISELAHLLPLTVVTELVGFSEHGKKNMLRWAAAIFNSMGPDDSPLTAAGFEGAADAIAYLNNLDRNDLDPDGWAAALFRAADNGDLSPEKARLMLMDYLGPALDTTINGLGNALWLFAQHHEQWDTLTQNPELVKRAIDEALRMESPVRGFTRVLTRDYDMDGVMLKQGERALLHYASANRDERRYADPDRFDITRDARDHVAFGYGTHMCAGRNLGLLEISTVLKILVQRVKRIHLIRAERAQNTTLRGFSKLTLRLEAS
jgi:cytochrome P450